MLLILIIKLKIFLICKRRNENTMKNEVNQNPNKGEIRFILILKNNSNKVIRESKVDISFSFSILTFQTRHQIIFVHLVLLRIKSEYNYNLKFYFYFLSFNFWFLN